MRKIVFFLTLIFAFAYSLQGQKLVHTFEEGKVHMTKNNMAFGIVNANPLDLDHLEIIKCYQNNVEGSWGFINSISIADEYVNHFLRDVKVTNDGQYVMFALENGNEQFNLESNNYLFVYKLIDGNWVQLFFYKDIVYKAQTIHDIRINADISNDGSKLVISYAKLIGEEVLWYVDFYHWDTNLNAYQLTDQRDYSFNHGYNDVIVLNDSHTVVLTRSNTLDEDPNYYCFDYKPEEQGLQMIDETFDSEFRLASRAGNIVTSFNDEFCIVKKNPIGAEFVEWKSPFIELYYRDDFGDFSGPITSYHSIYDQWAYIDRDGISISEDGQYFAVGYFSPGTLKDTINSYVDYGQIDNGEFKLLHRLPRDYWYYSFVFLSSSGRYLTMQGPEGGAVIYDMFEDTSMSNNLKQETLGVIYPNPVTDYLRFDFEFSKDTNYRLLRKDGVVVQKGVIEQNQIDVEELLSGFYILQITSKRNTRIFPFVKM